MSNVETPCLLRLAHLFLIPFFQNNFEIISNKDIIKNGIYTGSIKDYISESKNKAWGHLYERDLA